MPCVINGKPLIDQRLKELNYTEINAWGIRITYLCIYLFVYLFFICCGSAKR
jgi:hypothetical protein